MSAPPLCLAAGGSDFFLGDGRMIDSHEQELEDVHGTAVNDRRKVSLALQQIRPPGYYRDRGPASTLALRLHAEI